MRLAPACAFLLAITAASFAAETAPRVSGIAAVPSADGGSIVVTFAAADPARDLLLFWAGAPIASPEDLLGAAAVHLDPGTAAWAVPVPPGTTWWFAVLDAEEFKVGSAALLPGGNATAAGVAVPGGPAAPLAVRGVSLPPLAVDRAVDTGRPLETGAAVLPAIRAVAPATERAIAELRREAGEPPRPVVKVQVLDADVGADGDPVLRAAAVDPLSRGDWKLAEQRLREYLGVRRSGDLRARARFYLGQACWFQGRTRDAFLEFLLSEEALPAESRAWQELCLEALAAGR